MEKANKVQKEKAFSSINFKSFLLVIILLTAILIISGVMSYFIPQGEYQTDANENILPDTFQLYSVEGIAVWRIITAPFRVLVGEDSLTIIMISIFLLVMSGVFNVMEKTNGVKAVIKRGMSTFSKRKKAVILISVLFFMLFGSFFGMFEELVTLLPIIIMLFKLSNELPIINNPIPLVFEMTEAMIIITTGQNNDQNNLVPNLFDFGLLNNELLNFIGFVYFIIVYYLPMLTSLF